MYRQFDIGECIGRGGFGEVYRAQIVIRGKPSLPVALKVLHDGLEPESQAVQRLRDESRMLRALAHPNILKGYDLTVLEGRVAMVTEFVEGASLDTVIRKGPLSVGAVLEVGEAVACALHAARSTRIDGRPIGLIHRDIKPGNIFLSSDGSVRLLDFGIARTDELAREAETATDVVMGSVSYMAPEVLSANQASHASDVFALGLTLFEAVTGRRMFMVRGPALFRILLDPELFESERAKSLALVDDPKLRKLLESMCRCDPGARPDVRQVRDMVRHLRAGLADGLAEHVERYPLPAVPIQSGSLTGRVIQTDGPGIQLVDPNQATVIAACPTAPSAPARTIPKPTTTGRSQSLMVAFALMLIGLLMVVSFVGTYLVGTLSLRW